MAIKQITRQVEFQLSQDGKAVAALPYMPLVNWAMTVDVNGVSDDVQFDLEFAQKNIIANENIIGESVAVTFWASFDDDGSPTGESFSDHDSLVDRADVQSMINSSLSPAHMGFDETITKTLFVTLRTDTEVIPAVSESPVDPEVNIEYEIIHVPAFWSDLDLDGSGQDQSAGTIYDLEAIQLKLKSEGASLKEAVNDSV